MTVREHSSVGRAPTLRESEVAGSNPVVPLCLDSSVVERLKIRSLPRIGTRRSGCSNPSPGVCRGMLRGRSTSPARGKQPVQGASHAAMEVRILPSALNAGVAQCRATSSNSQVGVFNSSHRHYGTYRYPGLVGKLQDGSSSEASLAVVSRTVAGARFEPSTPHFMQRSPRRAGCRKIRRFESFPLRLSWADSKSKEPGRDSCEIAGSPGREPKHA